MWEVLSFSDAQEPSNNLISNGIIMIIGFHIFFPFVLCLCPFAFHSARYGRPNNMSHPNTTSPGEETKMIWWVEQTAYAASMISCFISTGLRYADLVLWHFGTYCPVPHVGIFITAFADWFFTVLGLHSMSKWLYHVANCNDSVPGSVVLAPPCFIDYLCRCLLKDLIGHTDFVHNVYSNYFFNLQHTHCRVYHSDTHEFGKFM